MAAVARDGADPQDETLVAAETERRLRTAVRALPEDLQAVVVARFWSTPVGEIARAEGVSRVAVRTRIGRALGRLAGALQEVTS